MANCKSPLGTPLQCAVTGVRVCDTMPWELFWVEQFRRFYRDHWTEEPRCSGSSSVSATIKCLLGAGAKFSEWSPPWKGTSLMEAAIQTAFYLEDLAVVTLLLAHAVTLTDKELGHFGFQMLKYSRRNRRRGSTVFSRSSSCR